MPLSIVNPGRQGKSCRLQSITQILFCTTYETKTGFLLIETFEKLFNPQIESHLIIFWWPFFIYQGQQEFRNSANLSNPKQCKRINSKDSLGKIKLPTA
jgi:hypothetical protein